MSLKGSIKVNLPQTRGKGPSTNASVLGATDATPSVARGSSGSGGDGVGGGAAFRLPPPPSRRAAQVAAASGARDAGQPHDARGAQVGRSCSALACLLRWHAYLRRVVGSCAHGCATTGVAVTEPDSAARDAGSHAQRGLTTNVADLLLPHKAGSGRSSSASRRHARPKWCRCNSRADAELGRSRLVMTKTTSATLLGSRCASVILHCVRVRATLCARRPGRRHAKPCALTAAG